MEIIVKIETNEDFIQSILDEGDPEKTKNLFTDQTLKDTFKIKEINNIEVNDPKNPVSILDALKSKSKRWNLLTKNFRKTKRAVKETGNTAAIKTKNASKRVYNTAKSIPVGAYKGVKAALKEENAKEYDLAKNISIGDDPTQKLIDSAMKNPKINALINKTTKDANRIANKGVKELNTVGKNLGRVASAASRLAGPTIS